MMRVTARLASRLASRPASVARRFFADVPAVKEEEAEGELAVVEEFADALARRTEQTGAFLIVSLLRRAAAFAHTHSWRGVELRACALLLKVVGTSTRRICVGRVVSSQPPPPSSPIHPRTGRALWLTTHSPRPPMISPPPSQSRHGVGDRSCTERPRWCPRRTRAMRVSPPSRRTCTKDASPKSPCRRSTRCKARRRG